MESKSNLKRWTWFFYLAALEAGAAFVALALVPHGGGGFSTSRLAVLAVLAGFVLVALVCALRLPRQVDALSRPAIIIVAGAAAFAAAAALFLLRYLDPEVLLPYYERLSPLLWYVLALAAEACVWGLWQGYGIRLAELRDRRLWTAVAIAFGVCVIGLAFVVITRIGLTPDSAYWGEPGVPVLGWQLAIALLAGLVVLLAGLRWKPEWRVDLLIAAAVWLLAFAIWLSVPVQVMKNSFYASIDPPANQPFPNSDAGYYDSMAQSLLIGYPYQGDIPTRPLYIVFLGFLHLIVGERYNLIIAGQTLLLALIPVVLYFLGKRLHSRAAGIIAALIVIAREWNSVLVSSQTRVSNTKTLLVDLPTLLLLLVACLVLVRWLERRDGGDALLAGGLFGLLLLLRTQSILLIPIAVMAGILAYGVRNRAWRLPMLLFLAGIAAAAVPWLVHNYLRTGQLALDAPFEMQVIASQYRYTGNLDLGSVDLTGKSLVGILLTFAVKDPKFVAGFVASHFFATLVDSVLALPLIARYDGLLAPLNLYWMNWQAVMGPANIGLLLLYLLLLSIGVAAAWKRLRWAGITPLALAVGYAFTNGIARFSGWRYDLPADWMAYFYAAIGAAELLWILAKVFGMQPFEQSGPPTMEAQRLPWRTGLLVAGGFALVSALPWMAEAAPPRYADQTLPVLMSRLEGAKAVQMLQVDKTQIEAFVADPQATFQIGRVLYPRYFTKGLGLASTHPWPAYAVRNYPRVGFLLLNQSRHDAVLAIRKVDANFAHGQDAIVLGCQQSDHIEVRLILFPDSDLAYMGVPLTVPCN